MTEKIYFQSYYKFTTETVWKSNKIYDIMRYSCGTKIDNES